MPPLLRLLTKEKARREGAPPISQPHSRRTQPIHRAMPCALITVALPSRTTHMPTCMLSASGSQAHSVPALIPVLTSLRLSVIPLRYLLFPITAFSIFFITQSPPIVKLFSAETVHRWRGRRKSPPGPQAIRRLSASLRRKIQHQGSRHPITQWCFALLCSVLGAGDGQFQLPHHNLRRCQEACSRRTQALHP